ncbi:hypothetical protein [Amycolatopsis sp. lyj-112]|uniref:hypothetical protein n=1 Tax=Amycolatopsis sp. lyj-112 TaxID=2789288 RepID=UPI0039782628
MSFTTAINVKVYLESRLGALLNDYEAGIEVVYGPSVSNDIRTAVAIGNVEWESYDTSSMGPRPKIYEIYTVECALLVEQGDGSPRDTDATAQDIVEILVEELRSNRTLGFNVDFTNLVPLGLESGITQDGEVGTIFKFKIQCEKNLA